MFKDQMQSYLDNTMIPYITIASAACGFLSHILLFRQGEWHMRAFHILRFAVLVFTVLTSIAYKLVARNIYYCLLLSLCLCTTYFFSLITSIIIYRLAFHRLKKFPGPILARATKFWNVYHCLSSKNHLLKMEIYQKYGDIVRTGNCSKSFHRLI